MPSFARASERFGSIARACSYAAIPSPTRPRLTSANPRLYSVSAARGLAASSARYCTTASSNFPLAPSAAPRLLCASTSVGASRTAAERCAIAPSRSLSAINASPRHFSAIALSVVTASACTNSVRVSFQYATWCRVTDASSTRTGAAQAVASLGMPLVLHASITNTPISGTYV